MSEKIKLEPRLTGGFLTFVGGIFATRAHQARKKTKDLAPDFEAAIVLVYCLTNNLAYSRYCDMLMICRNQSILSQCPPSNDELWKPGFAPIIRPRVLPSGRISPSSLLTVCPMFKSPERRGSVVPPSSFGVSASCRVAPMRSPRFCPVEAVR